VDELLGSAQHRAAFTDAFASRGLRIAALNCSAWPMHPVGHAFHDGVITRTLQLAGELGVDKVVTMSGMPGDGPGASTVNWAWFPWPQDTVAFWERAWAQGVEYWQAKLGLAEQAGVQRIAMEIHPLHLVYSVPLGLQFRDDVGSRRIGMNFDPSHLVWQQVDPVAAVLAAGDAILHCHVKDTRLNPDVLAVNGVLDRTPFNEPDHRSWTFVSAGRGHDAEWWGRIVRALREVGYDDVLSIEQEDPYVGEEEGVREVAAFVRGLIDDAAGAPS
jgi:sugar phosphate isomerase/epimerase